MPELRYLLISPGRPRIIAQSSNRIASVQSIFPVGLAYVSGAMKAEGYDVHTINGKFIDEDIRTYLHRYIVEHEIDVIGTGGKSIDVHDLL